MNRLSRIFCLSVCLGAMAVPCFSATLNVTTIADTFDGVCDANCSLRDAVSVSLNGDVVSLPAGTYALSRTGAEDFDFGTVGVNDIDVENSITIQGAGATITTIDATGLGDRVFDSNFFALASITFADITITGGNATGGAGIRMKDFNSSVTLNNAAVNGNTGNGVDTRGNLTLNNSTISGNTGSGIFFTNDDAAFRRLKDLNITGSTIDHNGGSGVHVFKCRNVNITNSTLSLNTLGGFFVQSANVAIKNATIAHNGSNGVEQLGFLFSGIPVAPDVDMDNCIVANNTGPDILSSGSGATLPTSLGYNLVSDNSAAAAFTNTGDQNNTDPLIELLALNAPGNTRTHALGVGSPALDAGNTTLTVDQRGVSRPQEGGDDIGAYEFASVDVDGDGFSPPGDCDDNDPDINPGETEVCDGVDNNCDGATDEGLDSDGDQVADCFDPCPNDNPDDTDGDGVCDSDDPCPLDDPDDSDGDGVCDSDDACPGFDDSLDGDGDAIPDGCDDCPLDNPNDTDGDGVCDSDDPCPLDNPDDSDADGVCDSDDPCPLDNPDDSDADGVCDSDDVCPGEDDALDSDGDQTPDCDDPCPGDNPDDTDGDGVCDSDDPCPLDNPDDTDGDGVCDSDDPCPLDNPDDSDGDGVCDSDDICPGDDDNTDTDGDGKPDGCDDCPDDANDDSDGDGVCDSDDPCPNDNPDDTDGDSVCDSNDPCPLDANDDSDGDGVCDSGDPCPNDNPDDTDGDSVCDSDDACPNDPNKTDPGVCDCGTPDTDTDGDLTSDCDDLCLNDPNKTDPGVCDCGTPDTDTDGDLTSDCDDLCPNDPNKTVPGICGCGTPDTDSDADAVPDCLDNCPNDSNPGQEDFDGDGVGNACDTSSVSAQTGATIPDGNLALNPGDTTQFLAIIDGSGNLVIGVGSPGNNAKGANNARSVLDSFGNVIAGLSALWSATGGTITDDGVYTPGDDEGQFDVTVEVPELGLSSLQVVEIAGPDPVILDGGFCNEEGLAPGWQLLCAICGHGVATILPFALMGMMALRMTTPWRRRVM